MLGSQHGPVVVPFEPEQSLLYTKCSGEHTGGERMPQDDMNFFDDKPEVLHFIKKEKQLKIINECTLLVQTG